MESIEVLTKNDRETKKLGELLAKEVLFFYAEASKNKLKTATVLSLEGELGSGKTTFIQGFAKGLGIRENPRSPTFVIMQIYAINRKPYVIGRKAYGARRLIHIDAYRIKSRDLKMLGWSELIKNNQNIILIEWGNKVKNILPKNSIRINFFHTKKAHERLIKIYSFMPKRTYS